MLESELEFETDACLPLHLLRLLVLISSKAASPECGYTSPIYCFGLFVVGSTRAVVLAATLSEVTGIETPSQFNRYTDTTSRRSLDWNPAVQVH